MSEVFCDSSRPCSAGFHCEAGHCLPGNAPQPVVDAGTCNPDRCPDGCCQNGACVTPATSGSACGKAGSACEVCAGAQVCTNGVCQAVSCPNGCVDGSGVCRVGTSEAACGTSGLACQQCPAGRFCISGLCRDTGACGPSTCAGCCRGAVCVPAGAQSVAECGAGGQVCTGCAQNQKCVQGACSSGACTSANCPGCCAGDICLAGTSNVNCGKNGAVCAACAVACQSQTCVTRPDAGNPSVLGTACNSDGDCAGLGLGAFCKTKTTSGTGTYLGGYCTVLCGPGAPCPANGFCAQFMGALGEADSLCLLRCTTTGGCRQPGYQCYQFQTGNAAACWIFPPPGP